MTAHAQYVAHRGNAKDRGIPFLLTFEEWLSIWEASGHFRQRGNRGGCYVMARYGDKGAYEVGNVKIITFEENSIERNLGRTHSQATKRKIGEARRGKTASEATKRKMSQSQSGRTHSEETKRKIAESNHRRGCPEETKRRISQAKLDWWARRKELELGRL